MVDPMVTRPRARSIAYLRQLVVFAGVCWAPWLPSCACTDSGDSTAPIVPDAAGQPDASDDGDAQSCAPKVCTPCDCGPIDDGCGGTRDCGPCPDFQTCSEIYGTVEGFELCEQTRTECSFRAVKNGTLSCREICEGPGGQCLATYGNGVGCETIYDEVDLGCDASAHDDDVCVCTRATDEYEPLPCRQVGPPTDGGPDAGPPPGTTLLYRVNFEDGTIDANPGTSHAETMSGGSITVVANPEPDGRNSSSNVGRHSVPSGYTRAELSSMRLSTEDQAYLYKWSYYVPPTFFDSTVNWNLISQWKTWPCGDHDGYDTEICGSCGIFNDLSVHTDTFHFKYRAEPDCFTASPPLILGQWVDFVSEVRWSNGNDGYVKLWLNDQLVYDQQGFKTLFDNFDPSSCNLYWAVGVYSNNEGGLTVYTDDIEIWEP